MEVLAARDRHRAGVSRRRHPARSAPADRTINCSAVNEKGEMSGATTTSGLAWKLAGRAGDSPIIGAGCYCDQDVGAAGATGNGEENIQICGAHTIVENMRRGMSPQEAGMDALKRIVRNYEGVSRKAAVRGHELLHPAQGWGLRRGLHVERPARSVRGASRYTTEASAMRPRSRCIRDSRIGWPPMPGRKHLAPEQKK